MFFFFKQKTAYEMRISDWSSDVCSSDLHRPCRLVREERAVHPANAADQAVRGRAVDQVLHAHPLAPRRQRQRAVFDKGVRIDQIVDILAHRALARPAPRSEEHTSELQSLMRISYAVFCLKKKNHTHSE